jgi:hypothetical protein
LVGCTSSSGNTDVEHIGMVGDRQGVFIDVEQSGA